MLDWTLKNVSLASSHYVGPMNPSDKGWCLWLYSNPPSAASTYYSAVRGRICHQDRLLLSLYILAMLCILQNET